jgi:pyridoxal phosphate enzyme (YggS family)
VTPARRGTIAANLDTVRRRIVSACAAAGRESAEITLVAVTKTRPVDDVRAIVELGVTDIGENRDQEAQPKAQRLAGLGITWHFVGRLQRNKARSVASYADVVHSVDRAPLVAALAQAARHRRVPLRCLVQVSLDDDVRRGGARPSDVNELGASIAAAPGLSVAGVMAIAPRGGDPDAAFARLARVGERLQAEQPGANVVSAGMSGDLEAAIRHGATHLRVGGALFGPRQAGVG